MGSQLGLAVYELGFPENVQGGTADRPLEGILFKSQPPAAPRFEALGKCMTPLCLIFLFYEMGTRVSRTSYAAVVLTVVTDGGGTWK